MRTVLLAIASVLSITLSSVYAVPPEHRGNCEHDGDIAGSPSFWCCWTETDSNDPEQIEIYKCQHCWIENGTVDCAPPVPDPNAPPTTKDDISPENTEGIEQPPTENQPPIKSGDSVAPNDDGKVLDEQQPNPNSPLTDQRVPHDNLGVLEQSEQATNFAKKGNSQNSPVPPECPKQGPIPPDCTMKPKF